MERTHIGKRFLELPWYKAYGYCLGVFVLTMSIFFVMNVLSEPMGTRGTIAFTLSMLVLSSGFALRFYRLRSSDELRSKLLTVESKEETIKIILGGKTWGYGIWAATCGIILTILFLP